MMRFFFEGFAQSAFGSVAIDDRYLFAVDTAVFWTLLLLTGVAAVAFAWLVNRPQPVPDDIEWIKNDRFTRRRRT